jgi:hypothetical protein
MPESLEAVQVEVDVTQLVVGQVKLRKVGQGAKHVLRNVPTHKNKQTVSKQFFDHFLETKLILRQPQNVHFNLLSNVRGQNRHNVHNIMKMNIY